MNLRMRGGESQSPACYHLVLRMFTYTMPLKYQRFRKKFLLYLLLFSLLPLPEIRRNGDSDTIARHQMNATSSFCTPRCVVCVIFCVMVTTFVLVNVICNGVFMLSTIVVQFAMRNWRQHQHIMAFVTVAHCFLQAIYYINYYALL